MPNIRHSLQSLADALSPDTNTHDGYVDNAETSLTRIADALPKKLGGKIEAESLAAEYDDQATYDIGDYCTHDGVFYICATAIATAESWTPAKWVAVPLIEILQEKLNAPADGAVAGRYLMVGQNGEPVWDQLDESDIRQSVYDWLSAHPEAIVVNDGTITRAKLDTSVGQAVDDVAELKADLLQKANIDGAYSDLTAGNAEQLVSTVYEEDSVPYIFRTAGGSMDIGDREEDMLVGGTVAWNQAAGVSSTVHTETKNGVTLTDNRDGTYSVSTASGGATADTYFMLRGVTLNVISGHKYLYRGCPTGGSYATYRSYIIQSVENKNDIGNGVIQNATATGTTTCIIAYIASGTVISTAIKFKPQLFDLTQMFGSTIANYIYSLEQATAGAGVAWFRKLFPADYYPFDAGTLKSVEGVSAHKTVGFNQWDEEWKIGAYSSANGEKVDSIQDRIRSENFIPVLPNTKYYKNKGLQIYFYDADKNYIYWENSFNAGTFTTRANAHYITFNGLANSGATYNHDICINLSWDGERDGEYEPYVKHSYPLDSSLTLRGIPKLDSANNLYYDGDTYESDGTVTRRYGIVDLGTLSWQLKPNGTNVFYSWDLRNLIKPNGNVLTIANIVCNKYIAGAHRDVYNISTLDKAISVGTLGELGLNDTAYTTREAISAALSGVYLVYELATPTTETADPYQNPQIVDDFGTEEYVTTSIVPVGHVTKYQPNLRAKLEMSPDSPDGDGDYIVRQANGENSYITLASTATIQDILARLTALEGGTNEG